MKKGEVKVATEVCTTITITKHTDKGVCTIGYVSDAQIVRLVSFDQTVVTFEVPSFWTAERVLNYMQQLMLQQ